MRLTRRSKYAVRALAELAEPEGRPGRCPCAAREVARKTRMPEAFVGQILGELARSGLVEGRRGADGGFRLAVAPEEVTVLDVVEVLDGGSWSPEAPFPDPDEPPAVARVWEEAGAALRGVLSRHTVAEISALEKARAPGSLTSVGEEGSCRTKSAAPGRG